MKPVKKKDINKLEDYLWEIPKSFRNDMRVPARVLASETLLDDILEDRSLNQLVNVASLPGIQKASMVMPDVHEGYGFPIGGVAATLCPDGVISPGGIGYDINCGVRLLRSELQYETVKKHIELLNFSVNSVTEGEDALGEAIVKLEVENFPLIVAIDSKGTNIYER